MLYFNSYSNNILPFLFLFTYYIVPSFFVLPLPLTVNEYITARHVTPFYLLRSLSPEQLTVVDIGGYDQPKGVLVCVTLSFTFKFSNNL